MVRARALRAIVGLVLLVGVGATGWWAGHGALPRPATSPGAERVTATVVDGTVGRSLPYPVAVRQPYGVIASNELAGIVRQALSSDGSVSEGGLLYTVGQSQVRAVTGAEPFWRDLAGGVKGSDVAQLQQALTTLGYYSGAVDGTFRESTRVAVTHWQKATEQEATGAIALGSLVAVPSLPTTVRLDPALTPGLRVSGGEAAVSVPAGAPTFWLELTPDQARRVPTGSTVTISGPSVEWTGITGAASIDADNTSAARVPVTAADGGAPCAPDCASLPVGDQMYLQAAVRVEAQVTGPMVPAAAVQSDSDGTAWVLMAGGARRTVTIRATSGGLAVVDGLSVGDEVLVRDGTPHA